ncbi:MAG TPA: serine hydrolase domain-containing protein [Pirellulales bacterium]|jgi:CubicO group peptidase (beta-lactamase class C family)|nr:serine hydrolase domain-containing protein [Pirellulales bacterium]
MLALVWGSASALVRAADFDQDKLRHDVRAALQKFVDHQDLAGAIGVVGTSQGVVCLEPVGKLTLDSESPLAADAIFRIASMTKPITALGLMQLVEQGKLAVDDPVEKYLPEFQGQMLVAEKSADSLTLKRPRHPILIRELLTHTSGMPDLPPGLSDLYTKRDKTLAEEIMAMSQRPLNFEPGSKWSYCNTGLDTAGRIIEVVAKQRYEDYLAEHVFRPLQMKDTTFYATPEQRPRLAGLYAQKDGKLVSAGHYLIGASENAKLPIPAGGLLSTGADLAKLYQALLHQGELNGHRVLGAETLATMTKTQTGDLVTGFTPGMSYGFGFAVLKHPQGVTEMLSPGTFGHGGAFGTQSWADPVQDVFVILLIQRVGLPNGDASDMRRDLQRAAYGAIKH